MILDLPSWFIVRQAFRGPLTAYPQVRGRRDSDDASPVATAPALGPQHLGMLNLTDFRVFPNGPRPLESKVAPPSQ